MPRFTVREFAKSLGLALEGADYIGAGVMLKVLASKGIAKEVDRINTSARGRKSVVYEVPEQFVLSVTVATEQKPVEEVVAEEPVEEVVAEVVAEEPVVSEEPVVEVEEVVVEPIAETFYYDDEDEDEDEVNEAA